jgi:outer membrane receptor protein involved in Fe transport
VVKRITPFLLVLGAVVLAGKRCAAQEAAAGAIRGVVSDADFDVPMAAVRVTIVELGRTVATGDQGNYVFSEVAPGRYTLTFAKDGYVRQVRADVVAVAGRLTDADAALEGEITEMDELVVQDALPLGGATEAGLLEMRFESAALMDSIGADFISRAGASDAAGALRLVAGATVQDGKTAVIRGLPDRYVSSQLNGVRLPSADEDKRAVELDQFPAAVIESIQVSKTFTPDQQGDASGGAVNLRLKGIPDEALFLRVKSEVSLNTQVFRNDDFLSYRGGGVDFLGFDDGERDAQLDSLDMDWDGAVGVSRRDAPVDYKWSLESGGSEEIEPGLRLGGFVNLFYERDSSFSEDGIDDSLWVENPGDAMTPQTFQGTVQQENFRTALFDVERAKRTEQWGALTTVGVEYEEHSLNLVYLYSRTTEDTATLAEDTRGKQHYFPGHDPLDPSTPGHELADAAPFVRLETLDYTERSTQTIQLNGKHEVPTGDFGDAGLFLFGPPQVDWTVAFSSADLNQPDKRQFGSTWFPAREPIPGFTIPATHRPFLPDATFSLGNLQRVFKEIEEESEQYFVNVKLPFANWTAEDGYLKSGFFMDTVERSFRQESYGNFGDSAAEYAGDFDDFWSAHFPDQVHPIHESLIDVDYEGRQEILAWYGMVDLPVFPGFHLIGGARFENTDISIVNQPEAEATWFPPGSLVDTTLNPGDADVAFAQEDVLPSIGFEYRPFADLTIRGSYNETIARQTFKELTPILQQEFLGGSIFIGNPELEMSAVKNYDIRVDYTPFAGGLISASWFLKTIDNPIEYVQRVGVFNFTTAVNYPKGRLSGFEIEVRQDLGQLSSALEGLSLGGNATLIDSEVTLPDDEIAGFALPNIMAPIRTRDMTNAPEHLYNIYLTYDLPATGTQLSLFYTVQGDTLLAGAGQSDGNFIPSVYAKEFGTLNFTLTQKLGEYFKLQFKAKNLTDPRIETVYRSKFIGGDALKTSFTEGIELSLVLSAEFTF